ncbi:hypothetical protein BGW41_006163, partial [Actinomortierella wolfii]
MAREPFHSHPSRPSGSNPTFKSSHPRAKIAKEYEAILSVPKYEEYTKAVPSFKTVFKDSVVYQGLPRRTHLMDLTNALHSTVGLTDGIFYLEQKSASRRIPYNTANFEVHFSNREGNAEEARERALTIPITLNGIQYVASEPVEQHLEVHRIL